MISHLERRAGSGTFPPTLQSPGTSDPFITNTMGVVEKWSRVLGDWGPDI